MHADKPQQGMPKTTHSLVPQCMLTSLSKENKYDSHTSTTMCNYYFNLMPVHLGPSGTHRLVPQSLSCHSPITPPPRPCHAPLRISRCLA
jgi:hypothetical protein